MIGRIVCRYTPEGYIFDFASPSIFAESSSERLLCNGIFKFPVGSLISGLLNPTLNLSPGVMASFQQLLLIQIMN